VLGDGGLADAELALDHRGDRAGRLFPLGEQLQDPAPDRIAEDVERVHASDTIRRYLYKPALK